MAFPDDDLTLRVDQWNHLFALARTHKLDLCQPALVDNGPQYVKTRTLWPSRTPFCGTRPLSRLWHPSSVGGRCIGATEC